jgi:hypothetical protein
MDRRPWRGNFDHYPLGLFSLALPLIPGGKPLPEKETGLNSVLVPGVVARVPKL